LSDSPTKGLALSEVCESKVGTPKELAENPLKDTPMGLSENVTQKGNVYRGEIKEDTSNVLKEKLSKCPYCNKNVKSISMLNYKKFIFLDNEFTSYSCC